MATVEAVVRCLHRDAEAAIFVAMTLEFLPITGGERNSVAVEDGSARDLSCERIDAWIVLRAFDVVLFEGLRIAREVFAIVQHLVSQGETHQDQACAREYDLEPAHRSTKQL